MNDTRAPLANVSAILSKMGSLKPNVTLSTPADAPTDAQSSLSMLGGLILGVFTVIPSILYWTISFVTITLPTWLFTFLSTSLTFTMNMTTLLLLLTALASSITWFVRYRYLNMYSRLPPEPQRKEPQIEIFPDAQETDSKPGLANYFDEFLSAIKVFGYLERPVFHELTRTMQTRKLMAGETLLLEEEKGFCIVVDGLVQIFVKSSRDAEADVTDEHGSAEEDHGEERGAGNRSYQLLTEVKNGAPMSSLFSILSLFTENVKLRFDEEDEVNDSHRSSAQRTQNGRPHFSFDGAITPDSSAESPAAWNNSGSRPVSSHNNLPTLATGPTSGGMKDPPPLALDGSDHTQNHSRRPSFVRSGSFQRKKSKKQFSAHPDIVARATVDTTIAIIPASAFHRITRIYPKATAHIVQVILTRLQRVTLSTGHAYLGLTSEVLRTERLMDRYTTYDLPDFLRGQALQRLKDKFRKDQERIGPEESMKGIALHNPRVAQQRRRASSSLRRDAALQARMNTNNRSPNPAGEADDRNGVSAGDLLTNIHAARTPGRKRQFGSFSQPYSTPQPSNSDIHSPGGKHGRDPFNADNTHRAQIHRQESMDEDGLFRDSIMECMAKAVGLTSMQNMKRTESAAQSPRLVSYDSRNKTAVFNNAFGFIDPYEASIDDSESAVSTSAFSFGGSANMSEDLKNEIEIVYFPRGSVLVEEGERNPGLYYVIDGFLDVSASVDEKENDIGVLGSTSGAGLELPEFMRRRQDRRTSTSNRSASMSARDHSRKRKQSRRSLFLIKPGGLAGYLGTVSSYRSFIDVTAKTNVYVGFLPRNAIEKIVERHPIVLLTLAKRLTNLLPRLILHIDFAPRMVAGQRWSNSLSPER